MKKYILKVNSKHIKAIAQTYVLYISLTKLRDHWRIENGKVQKTQVEDDYNGKMSSVHSNKKITSTTSHWSLSEY